MENLLTIRPELLELSDSQFQVLKPYFITFLGVIVALMAAVIRKFGTKWPVFCAVIVTFVLALAQVCDLWAMDSVMLFNNMMIADRFSSFFNILFLGSGLLTVLVSFRYLDREQIQYPEYYILLLISTIGMMLMASTLDLITFFIALEIMSLTVYTLVGFRRADRRSNEAAVKYFILGGVASAVFLYGVALLYGATGTTNIHEIIVVIRNQPEAMSPIFTMGFWFVVVSFLFKVAAVPFHMWTPDVYEGAPTPVTGFMTSGVKAAAFAAFVRVFTNLGYGGGISDQLQSSVHDVIWVLALATMIIGNLIALAQTNVKRMLAYSSVAHSGYLLVGVLVGTANDQSYSPVLMYLLIYAVMNIGAFGILSVIASRGDGGLSLSDFSGLAKRHPILAFGLSVFLLSMAGIPPTAGFAAKYYLFYAAVQAGEILLVALSVLWSVVSVYYYLRVMVYMYMREPVGSVPAARIPVWSSVAIGFAIFVILELGILPNSLIAAVNQAVSGF